MRALLDLNVLLDVIQKRAPHYAASAAVVEAVIEKRIDGLLAAHAVTTIDYIVGCHRNRAAARRAVDWLLQHFDIAAVDRHILLRARTLDWNDFEDAVVAAAAKHCDCNVIVTRNVRDFPDSPVTVLTPEELLLTLPDEQSIE